VYFWVLSIVVVSFWRATFREVLRVFRRGGLNLRYAIIVGGGAPAGEILGALRHRPDLGIQVLGVLGDKEQADVGPRWLGRFEDLGATLDSHDVSVVSLALPQRDSWRLGAALADIGDEPVTIHLVPDVVSLTSLRGGIEELEGVPLIHLRESPLHGWNRVL